MGFNTTTTDLADFGYREKEIAGKLLIAMSNGELPDEFYDSGIQVMLNMKSGNVFLTNDEYQVAMFNGDKLEMFYFLPYGGEEGFAEDFKDAKRKDYHKEDWDYIKNIIRQKN